MTYAPNNHAGARFGFDNTYARELEGFYVPWKATQVAQPTLVKFNRELAEELGLDADALDSQEGARIFAGNETPEGAAPLAQAYAGHQFGGFVPQLGDGRALLLGEVIDRNGRRRDIQLKGSGPTPFSRAGDGRAALGPVLREYLIGEAMHALGIPTTRTLAAVLTGEPVFRESTLPGAILTRVAASHIRVAPSNFSRPVVSKPKFVASPITSSIAITQSLNTSRTPTSHCSSAYATNKRRSSPAGCMWDSSMA